VIICGCRPAPPTDNPSPPPAGPGTGAAAQQILLGACCGSEDSTIMQQMQRYESTPEESRSPEVAVFPYRMTSGITRRDRIVIEDEATWARIWPEIVGSHSPKPPLPRVDFAREVIVIASMGQRSSGGYVISIDSALARDGGVSVVVTERSPGRTCGTTAALSSPVALARIARQASPIRFVEKTAVTDCG
jgi:hypothetical protein